MTDWQIQMLLARLERSYRHDAPETFGNMFAQAQADCTDEEWQQVRNWFQSMVLTVLKYKILLKDRPKLRLLLGVLYRKRTLYNELMRQPMPKKCFLEFTADDQGYFALNGVSILTRRTSIESLHHGMILMFGEEGVSELTNGRFMVNVPLDISCVKKGPSCEP